MSINKPKSLNRSGKLLKNWNKYKENFKSYLKAAGIKESDNKQAGAIFLETIGLCGFEIATELQVLNLTKDNIKSDISLQDLYQHFDNHCQFNYNLTLSRYQFFNTKQGKEDFEVFLASLNEISKNCEFGDLRDSLLMIQIISGISNKELLDDLYPIINDLDLEETIQKCRARKPKTSLKETPDDIQISDFIDANNDVATPERISTSGKRHLTEIEKAIPENSHSASKIPRKTISEWKSNAVSETETKLAENKDKHKSKKRHISTEENETNKKKEPQDYQHTKSRNLNTFDQKDYATSSANSKLAEIKSESELEEGEIPEVATTTKNKFICKICGENQEHHRYGRCPHYGEICRLCGRRSHIAKACRY